MVKLATRPWFVVVLLTTLPSSAGETLYNGIVLPDVWPPRVERLTGEPMPVPYCIRSGSVQTARARATATWPAAAGDSPAAGTR
jgi:hypothetical protein